MSTARPILMSAPMVSALREGRQTQIVEPQPESHYAIRHGDDLGELV